MTDKAINEVGCITSYKKQIMELNKKAERKEIDAKEYFKQLAELDRELIDDIRHNASIPVFSAIF